MTDRERSARGRKARRRGHDWERELVNLLKEKGIPAKRVVSETKYGNIGDVLVPSDRFRILFQCKAGKKPNYRTAMTEAEIAVTKKWGNWNAMGATYETQGIPGAEVVRHVVMDVSTLIDLLVLAGLANEAADDSEDDDK